MEKTEYNKLKKGIFILAWPAVLEMMLHMTVGVADTAMVGRLDKASLGAVSLSAQIFFNTCFIFAAISIGTTALVARCFGGKEYEELKKVTYQSMMLGWIMGIFLFLLFRFGSLYLIRWLKTEQTVKSLMYLYLTTISYGALFLVPNDIVNGAIRGMGKTKIALISTGIANTVNIVLDYCLIFGKWGLPAMGVKGAALASFIGMTCGSVYAHIYLIWKIRPSRSVLRFNKETFVRVLKISIPAGMEEAFTNASRIVSGLFVANLGVTALAAHNVARSAESLSFMPGYGFAVAATTLVGQNLGAGKAESAEVSATLSAKIATIVMSAMGILFFFCPEMLARIFTPDEEVIKVVALCLRMAAIEQPFLALTDVFSASLKGAGETRWPLFSAIVGGWIVRVLGTYLIIAYTSWSIQAIWALMIVEYAVKALILGIVFKKGKWKGKVI